MNSIQIANRMNEIFENLINGNLSDAKRLAQSIQAGEEKLAIHAAENFGYSWTKAKLAAHYLKTGNSWQAYCDAD